MTDMKRVKDCPECGTTLQFGSGCYHCPECGFGRCGKHEAIKTAASFVLMVVLISLMGWSAVDFRPATPAPQLIDKEMLRLYTADALAKHTASVNERFEQQAASK